MPAVTVEIRNRQKDFPLTAALRAQLRKACAAALEAENFVLPAHIDFTLADGEFIRELNKEHRGKDAVTDVLSFPQHLPGQCVSHAESGVCLLGDIVLCPARAAEQAETYGHSVEREISFLTVHAVLHLLGHDHGINRAQTMRMRAAEKAAMALLAAEKEKE